MQALELLMDLKDLHHEFHTPLTGVIGLARLLLEENTLSVDQVEMIKDILVSGERLLDLVDNHILNSPLKDLNVTNESNNKIKEQTSKPTLFLILKENQPHIKNMRLAQ